MPDEQTPDEDADCPYVVGETYARKGRATFEFKPSATGYTGGGYARVRSKEDGPEVSRPGMGDVFVSIHRLAAVVWCYDADRPLDEITDHLRDRDVHHTTEMPSANGPDLVEVLDHGEHSSRTNAAPSRTEQLAYARDAERERQRRDADPTCAKCGDDEPAAKVPDAPGRWGGEKLCLDCATDLATAAGEMTDESYAVDLL